MKKKEMLARTLESFCSESGERYDPNPGSDWELRGWENSRAI